MLLPPPKAGNRSLIHEVVPTADGETGNVHLVEVQRAVLGFPVVIIRWMLEPFGDQTLVVFGVSGDSVHPLESYGTSCAANSVAFLVQAQARVPHVLTDEMRRLRHRQIILSVPALRTSECSNLPRAPLLLREPFTRVIPVGQLTPLQRPITNPGSLRFLGTSKIHESDDVAGSCKSCCCLSRRSSSQTRIALLENGRPWSVAGRYVEIC